MKLYDARWEGAHGIGRFAVEIHRRLPGFRRIALSGAPSAPLEPLRLTRHLRALAPRLYFSPGYNAPVGTPCPFAFCLHDLNHLFVPENTSALKRAYYRHVVRPAIHRAEVVFTVSEFSRRAICEWSGADPLKVVNVGNGISAHFRPDARPAADNGRAARGIDRPYLLYVGSHKPHKNLPRLAQAFAACGIAREVSLIVTGAPSQGLRRLIASLRLADRVLFIEHASEQRLAELYRGAVALILVSTYEGFGLPIVEAMACGTPVVTSTTASMPEIAGDAALLVDPYDIDAIGTGLVRIATDHLLRAALRERGLAHARRYSWDETARRVGSALRARLADESFEVTQPT